MASKKQQDARKAERLRKRLEDGAQLSSTEKQFLADYEKRGARENAKSTIPRQAVVELAGTQVVNMLRQMDGRVREADPEMTTVVMLIDSLGEESALENLVKAGIDDLLPEEIGARPRTMLFLVVAGETGQAFVAARNSRQKKGMIDVTPATADSHKQAESAPQEE